MSDYQQVHDAADRAGVDAARTTGFTMACGSAIVIFPSDSSYADWLVDQGKANQADLSASDGVWFHPALTSDDFSNWPSAALGQSYIALRAYAEAYAAVLQQHDIEASVSSRLD
jgi:hypothetical protein